MKLDKCNKILKRNIRVKMSYFIIIIIIIIILVYH